MRPGCDREHRVVHLRLRLPSGPRGSGRSAGSMRRGTRRRRTGRRAATSGIVSPPSEWPTRTRSSTRGSARSTTSAYRSAAGGRVLAREVHRPRAVAEGRERGDQPLPAPRSVASPVHQSERATRSVRRARKRRRHPRWEVDVEGVEDRADHPVVAGQRHQLDQSLASELRLGSRELAPSETTGAIQRPHGVDDERFTRVSPAVGRRSRTTAMASGRVPSRRAMISCAYHS